ncbi:ABC transporter permease [Cohnella kolymensis]|uniref:ABC transporter permease n=1 Tax=Cohnella kolymensis TaxID=1590652 RepID=A0ABR5A904_9BACL|nr:carbohydrate ABC transporter permease [Cohnella kolymensis]KIL37472.1 ABC transporter permease [Cohnella kolymensis]
MQNLDRGILSVYDYRKKSNSILFFIAVIAIVGMVASMLYPILITVFNGLKSREEVFAFPPTFVPSQWVWENFDKGWHYIDLMQFLRNTLSIFAGNLVATVLILGLAAFSLSKLQIPYRKPIYFFFLSTLFIPPTTYIIPNFVNLRDLGLLNTFWAFWLPAGASAFYLLLLKNFFDGIHNEMFEAARIDGASEWRCFIQIALPLSVPIFSTLAIFVFSNAWNDWFWPNLVLQGDNIPLATAIYKFVINARGLPMNVRFAILTMVMLPPIIVFLVFQKYIMRGLQLGGVKG